MSPTTSSVKAGASAYLMVVLAARVDSCRLVALRPDGTGPTRGAITPSKTHVEWSWLVPARTRSAIWRLRATCGPSQATVRLAVDGQSTGPVTLVVDAHVRQFGGPLAAVRTVVPAVVIAPRIKVLAARWWGISANRILARFQAGSSAGQCTAYAAWRPDVIGRVDSLAYAEYLLRGSTGPLAVDWNADIWAADAQRAGMSTGGVPRAGAVIVFTPGGLRCRRAVWTRGGGRLRALLPTRMAAACETMVVSPMHRHSKTLLCGAPRWLTRWRVRTTVALAAALGAIALAPGAAQAQFELGLQDTGFQVGGSNPAAQTAYRALRAIDGSTIRVGLEWAAVAPGGNTEPAGFHPANPADPKYNWAATDGALRSAAQRHARVVLTVSTLPAWAEQSGQPASIRKHFPGTWDPNPRQYGAFAHAAALRYSGRFPDPLHRGAHLPRVKYWEIWNEENLPLDLTAPNVVAEYRDLLGAAYDSIKAVHPDSLIATGGLAPVSYLAPLSISPLKFAAELLCLRRVGTSFRRSGPCPHPARFDIFAMHPYTVAATPTKHAYRYDDVLVGDMGKIASVVRAADKLHTVAPRTRHQIWVTEWGWFTNPPNKTIGDSYSRAGRYVAYAMYEMWHSGVSLVVWLNVADQPSSTASNAFFFNGGGLYAYSGRAKPSLHAFAFPLVAGVSGGRGFAWGRAPVSRRVRVVVERAAGRGWKQVARALTGSDGVFEVHFGAQANGVYRARVVHGDVSLAYNSAPIPGKRTHLFYSG